MVVFKQFLGPATAVYACFLVVWVLLRFFLADDIWWVAKLSSYPIPLLALAIPLSLAIWRTRQRHLGWGVLPALVVGLWFYAPLFWPAPPPAIAEDGYHLTVMSYNILFKNKDFASLREDILTHQPDIVGIQEATPVHAAAFLIQLGNEYPYQVYRDDYYQGNVALLSRYPITAAHYIDIPPRQMAMHTTVEIGEQSVHILIAHLLPNWLAEWQDFPLSQVMSEVYAWRMAEVEALLAEIEGVTEPTMLLCDCNMTQTSAAYKRLSAVWTDSFREAGWGPGLTSHAYWPIQRIDYIWHSDHFASQRAWLGPRSESDHRAVVADLFLFAIDD